MNFVLTAVTKELFAILEREIVAYAPELQAEILLEVQNILQRGIALIENKIAPKAN